MIVTTTPTIEGKVITSYLGLVSGSALHNVGGLVGEGYLNSSQSMYISADIASATKKMVERADELRADAVVGVQVTTGASAGANQIITTCIGTAVKLGLSPEELARVEREKQEKAAVEAAAKAKAAEEKRILQEKYEEAAAAIREGRAKALPENFFEIIENMENAAAIFQYLNTLDIPGVDEMRNRVFESVKIEKKIGNAKMSAIASLRELL